MSLPWDARVMQDLAEQACTRLANKVIAELQCFDCGLLSGDDSGLENTWGEICVQVQ